MLYYNKRYKTLFIKIENKMIAKTPTRIPKMELRYRKRSSAVYETSLKRGVSPLLSAIISGRITDVSEASHNAVFSPSLANMKFWNLKDIDIASKRIMEARLNDEIIGLVTDFDVDGITSAVVMKLALVKYMGFKEENVKIHVNNRVLYGYGVTKKAIDAVIERSKDRLPTLLITADQGSNNSNDIKYYKEVMESKGATNASVIVSDHHHIDSGETCEEAVAFINPQRPDCDFEDPTICGCVVALLLMSSVRTTMIENGVLPEDSPKLTPLLTFAALATVADCVSLAGNYNRFIVRKGLKDMNEGLIPAWEIWKENRKGSQPIDAAELAFKFAPTINADSRTGGDGSDSVNFLMSETLEEARYYYEKLVNRNERRKEIDLNMQTLALEEASRQYYKLKKKSIVLYLENGNHGIHGIVASRVKEKFSCPTIIFSPANKEDKNSGERLLSGSGRCIDDLNLVAMVKDDVAKVVPLNGGGHPAAMGVKIKLKDLVDFQDQFESAVCKVVAENDFDDSMFRPHVFVDHLFQGKELNKIGLNLLDEIKTLEPYGQKFPEPIFAINATIVSTKPFGKGANENAHLNFILLDSNGNEIKATCFFYKKEPWVDVVSVGSQCTFAVSLSFDSYQKNGVGFIIRTAEVGVNAIIGKV